MWGYIFAGMLVGAVIGFAIAMVTAASGKASAVEARDTYWAERREADLALSRQHGFGDGYNLAMREQRAKHRDRGLKASETRKANRAQEVGDAAFNGQGVA